MIENHLQRKSEGFGRNAFWKAHREMAKELAKEARTDETKIYSQKSK